MGTTNFDDLNVNTATVAGALTVGSVASSGLGTGSSETGITAAAGGTQAAARALTKRINSVDTVATAADSVKLPLAVIGQSLLVLNNTATSMQVFGSGTDTIDIGAGAVATATGVAQAAHKLAEYVCVKSAPAGNWARNITA